MNDDINGVTGSDETDEGRDLADFIRDLTGGDEAEAARLTASYDQHHAFTAEALSMLDMWVTASLVAIEQGQEEGSAAAMMRARVVLDGMEHRELQMLLMTLMATYVSAKVQLDGGTITERLQGGTRNNGYEVFQRFLASGGDVCMHCGEDAVGGYCEEVLRDADGMPVCTCGTCPDAEPGDRLEEMLARAFGDIDAYAAKLDVPDDLSQILPPTDGTGDQK